MKLYHTSAGCILEVNDACYRAGDDSWDALATREDLEQHLQQSVGRFSRLARHPLEDSKIHFCGRRGDSAFPAAHLLSELS